jgi:arginase
VIADGAEAAAAQVLARLEAQVLGRAWLHVDFDVLDESVMPAVDSPGKPGFDYAQLSGLVRALVASGRIAGADFAIYDPERDPGHRHAPELVRCIAQGIGRPAAVGRSS